MTKTSKSRYWLGDPPTRCELCREPIRMTFTDGATRRGGWALMCPCCFGLYGLGLGTGRGQQYTQQPNGKWLKTAA
jgi:hypothetical protein